LAKYRTGIDRYILCCIFLLTFSLFALPIRAAEKSEDTVVLDAEKVTYDQHGNIAIAEGKVRLKWNMLRLYSPYVELDMEKRFVTAFAENGEKVVLLQGNQRLCGEKLEYDLDKEEGALYEVSGTTPAEAGTVFLKGKEAEVVPFDSAVRKKWLHRREKSDGDEKYISKWQDVTLTTCPSSSPHYRIVSKKIIYIPGKRIIAKNPDIYIGKHKVFKYPFDYIVDLAKKDQSAFMPSVQYDSDKGVGLGFNPRYYLGDSRLDLHIIQWSDADFEWAGSITQDIGNGFSLFAKSSYIFDTDVKDKSYRPSWGINWENSGWTGHLRWSEREPRDTETKSGKLYRTTLWRAPELYIRTPWQRLYSGQNNFWSLSASYGDYMERDMEADRAGFGIHLMGDRQLNDDIGCFWRYNYDYFNYEGGDTQNVRDALLGIRWNLGSVGLTSSYYRRWVTGNSPMAWDNYDDISKVYQQFIFPLNKGLSFTLRGAYNLETENLDERVYQFDIDNNCCMKWVIAYRDDLVDDDDWAYLRLVIKAFPSTKLAVDSRSVSDRYE